mmetsp:Transcript_28776/g.77464  ORF Transcript_28776/g.77464 Transcript_28776/m.77464 type:complete len:426 (+) Transcript_28776:134-1411(+)
MAKLVGCDNFVRNNPRSDKFEVLVFHHIEFVCGDAQSTAARWAAALGMDLVARTDLTTGNSRFSSRALRSRRLRFVFSAASSTDEDLDPAFPSITLSPAAMTRYVTTHGLAVFAVGIHVADARVAFERAVASGAVPATEPRSAPGDEENVVVSEVLLHADGDTVLRFVSGEGLEDQSHSFLPGYTPVASVHGQNGAYGFDRVDHVVSNVSGLLPAVDYIMAATGFHEFAEFTAADVGTINSGLNSMVLASNNELVLLPVNEPTTGGKRKSQIQTYLDQHRGPGVQHIALKTDDIFYTVRAMRSALEGRCGFELMDRPRKQYYQSLPTRLGKGALTEDQLTQCEELGLLADRDDQGVLLQVFTKPVGDRATIFLEIIQRVGCMPEDGGEQLGGCGGFGKGNFHELFRAIEEYETKAGINGQPAGGA